MKTASLWLCLLAAGLSGCGFFASNNVREADAARVPADRLLAYQAPGDGLARITVVRETGFAGGGCYFGLEIDRVLAARFDTGELAQFFVKPGMREFAVVSDPQGRGLCGVEGSPARTAIQVQPGTADRFAITTRIFRRPEVEPSN